MHHAKLAWENFEGARSELKEGRFSNVGLLSLKALEQLIEACVAKEGLHFHDQPKIAHSRRREWLERSHPDLVVIWDRLWGIYGALGYGGVNGDRASKAVSMLEKVMHELSKREGIVISSSQ